MISRDSTKVSQVTNVKKHQVDLVNTAVASIRTPLDFDGKPTTAESKPVEISARTGKPKRRKAVRACTNCQRTHLTCDDDRPCERCVKRGCADTCVDGDRKKPKRARPVKPGGSQNKNNNMIQYGSDYLVGEQGPVGVPNDMHQHHNQLNHLGYPPQAGHSAYSRSHNMQAGQLPHAASSPSHPQGQPMHPPLTQTPQLHQPHTYQLHAPPLGGDMGHHLHPLGIPSLFQRIQHSVYSNPLDGSKPSNQTVLEAYGFVPDYFQPCDSFPLATQPPLHRFKSEIHGARMNKKEGFVFPAMLQGRPENIDETNESTGEYQHSSDGGGLDYISNSNDEDLVGGVASQDQSMLTWLEPPTNPLANAHNEPSRRFSYNYEQTDPSEIYRRVKEPFPNRKVFYQMIKYLKKRLDPNEFKQLTGYLSKIKLHFGTIYRPLSREDNLFVEQSFQRSLYEEEKQFALTPVACLVWRRSGLIAAVSPRFSKLTQWPAEQLKSSFVMRAMNNESIQRYFERYQDAIFNQLLEFKFDCSLLTPEGDSIFTEAEVTIRKDLFNMPLTLLGRFWVKNNKES